VQPAVEPGQGLPQALQVALAIIVIQKTRQTVVATLHNVLRNTCEIESRKSGHAKASPPAGPRTISDYRYCVSEKPHTACRKLSLAPFSCDQAANSIFAGLPNRAVN